MAWGEGNLPGRRPPWEIRSTRAGAPPEAYIKGGGEGGLRTLCPGASLSLSNTSSSSVRARRSPVGVLRLHHRHAVVLLLESSSPTSPLPCWIKKEETSRFPYVC